MYFLCDLDDLRSVFRGRVEVKMSCPKVFGTGKRKGPEIEGTVKNPGPGMYEYFSPFGEGRQGHQRSKTEY